MAKTSTPKNPVKIVEAATAQPVLNEGVTSGDGSFDQFKAAPSAHIISNILNYSKALEVKTSASGKVIAVVKN
jgi:hypothetical protein